MEKSTITIDKNQNNNDFGFFDRIKNSIFFIKLTNWEYWPIYISNIPLIFFWLWFAFRARNLFFFSAVNPVIETGGLFGESKYNILKRIPSSHVPTTIFIKQGTDFQEINKLIEKHNLSFPIIAKPDVGERGTLVSKIKSEKELAAYVERYSIDFLIQAYVDLPVELAVMHHRMPGQKSGMVTSICIKETLKITGNGSDDVLKLMHSNPRSKLQIARFRKEFPEVLNAIPGDGEIIELEPIGNHCRGTMFLNGNHHIDDQLIAVFDIVAHQMEDIYYGRFDMKCQSIDALKNNGDFIVMEYNGIGAEPAHIYDPSYPFFKKYKDIYRHWRIIYQIYKLQKNKGIKSMSFKEAKEEFRRYSNYQNSLKEASVK